MMDRPTSLELIQAVRHFLEKELQPALTDARLRFQTLVAAHVLGIVERELPVAEALLEEEGRLLEQILGQQVASGQQVHQANAELCQRIRQGMYDDPGAMQDLLGRLRLLVLRKLEVANPRHLAALASQAASRPSP